MIQAEDGLNATHHLKMTIRKPWVSHTLDPSYDLVAKSHETAWRKQ